MCRTLAASTGHLPVPEIVTTLVVEAYNRFKSKMEGKKSIVYPALERVQRDLFGVCVVDTSGTVYAAGDAEYEFAIMSVDLAKLRDQSSYVIQRTGGTGIRAACS